MIVCLIHHKNQNLTCTLSNVYGRAQADNRDKFLCEFSEVCSRIRNPMLFCEDFNILRKSVEKNKPVRWSFIFNTIIQHHDLIELELSNRMFTWSNNRANPTFEKLDRFFVSHDWDLSYMNSLVKGLNRDLSNHVPLMLCVGKDIVKCSTFRYELSWIKRPILRMY